MQAIKKAQFALFFATATAAVTAFAVESPQTVAPANGFAVKTFRPLPREEMVPGLMIKPRQRGGEKMTAALSNRDSVELSRIAGAKMVVFRAMSGGAHVVRLAKPVPLSEARAIAARLMQDGSVEMAEPDRVVRPLAPATDPLYLTKQWHYKTPDASIRGGANLPAAWDKTIGVSSVVVAVLDTGIVPHEDIAVAPASVLNGYDFVTNFSDKSRPRANDGDGRDANASDPGDFASSGDFCFDSKDAKNNQSSWHGTHVAGTIIASMNNAKGGTGIASGATVLPVRVLGTCGGVFSDIIDGMRWAAGIPNPNLPANSTPARVLNLSLGGAPGACSPALQSAVNDVINEGAVIVAATGNENVIGVLQPANCSGVVAVTGHSIDGDTTTYANIGPETAISAPGGGCGENNAMNGKCDAFIAPGLLNRAGILSPINSGLTLPDNVAGIYGEYIGTSMAAPHVAGVAALMLSRNSTLMPAQVKTYLQSSARPFPATSACVNRPSYAGQCGSGLLDAASALQTVDSLPPYFTSITPKAVVAPGTTMVLSATASASSGSIVSYQWSQTSGPSVALANPNQQNVSFVAPATGVLSFEVKATDDAGRTGVAPVVIRVNSLPVPTALPAQSIGRDQRLVFELGATDADNDAVVFTGLSLPQGAELTSFGSFSWPRATPAGEYTVTYAVSDQDGSTEGSVTVNVTAPNSGGGGGGMEGGMLVALAILAAGRRFAVRLHARGR